MVIGNTHIETSAEGRGGGNFIAKLPKDISVSVGDLVTFPGLSPKFFGTVGSIEQTVAGSFQSILFTLPINVNSLEWVEIAK